MNMDITRFLIEGREEQYLRHFFRDFAVNPTAMPADDVEPYVMPMPEPGNRRASLNHFGYIPQMAAQTTDLTKGKPTVPMRASGGRVPFGDTASIPHKPMPFPRREVSSRSAVTEFSKRRRSSSGQRARHVLKGVSLISPHL